MEGVTLLSFFVGFALLLGPLSYTGGQDGRQNYKYPDFPPPPHDRPPPPPPPLDEEGDHQRPGGSSRHGERRGERPEVCAVEFKMKSKEFCECVIGRQDNFFCDYDCHCLLVHCESSRCHPTKKAIVVIVVVSVSLLGVCMLCCGLGCLAYCWLNERHRAAFTRYHRYRVMSSTKRRRRRRQRLGRKQRRRGRRSLTKEEEEEEKTKMMDKMEAGGGKDEEEEGEGEVDGERELTEAYEMEEMAMEEGRRPRHGGGSSREDEEEAEEGTEGGGGGKTKTPQQES